MLTFGTIKGKICNMRSHGWQGFECIKLRGQGKVMTGARMYKTERPRMLIDRGHDTPQPPSMKKDDIVWKWQTFE